ncbi:hypothetical protein [Roseibium sp. RKSG952]|uniref:hypothetical protein n=1 Tax=Roseibium sp. RKSG952 TaxID=2529384 RepID=UPI0012BCD99E|nr:hypothetical protein [Roseibium sp. RKSG952]MTH96586.1 hypothetical protein [Roseibium sp. RKSG952]
MLILAAKIISTVVIVLGLSGVAEFVGPALAGLLSALPLGVALVFFFLGIQQGPEFLVQAATYTIAGLVATLCFNLVYWYVARRAHRLQFLKATGAALVGYLAAALIVTSMHFNLAGAVGFMAAAAVLSIILMRNHADTQIVERVRMTWQALVLRSAIAIAVVVAITGIAGLIGPKWSGLLAGFPMTLFPLMIIMHFSYSTQHVFTVIKGYPYGLPSIVIFVLVAAVSFGPLGVYLGTGLALLSSLVWPVTFLFGSRYANARRQRSA